MKLHTREWGAGDRVAVLVHGIMADSRCWWRVGPALAERGYRVVAVDLPGHGRSPRADLYSPESFASSLVKSVPADPEIAIGHSIGALALAVAVERLKPHRAIYSDPAFYIHLVDGVPMTESLVDAKDATREEIAAAHPGWSAEEVDLELEMLPLWDPYTAKAVGEVAGVDFTPTPMVPSLIQIADPSHLVTAKCVDELVARGFEVRVVTGAEHTIHRHLFEDFMASLDGWI